MGKSGTGGIAENILRRAIQLAKSAPTSKLETLRSLSEYAHTAALAADVYYEIGLELTAQITDSETDDAKQAFTIANEFIAQQRNDTENPYHIGSVVELGRIALEGEGDAAKVVELFEHVKNVQMEDDAHVQLLVLEGRAHVVCWHFSIELVCRSVYF